MSKKFFTVILCVLMFAASCVSVFAASGSGAEQGKNDITKTETFTTTNADFKKKDFAQQIEENGKKYDLKGVNYKLVSSKVLERKEDVLHKVDYSNLYEQNVTPAETLTVTKDGKQIEVKLSDFSYTPTTITNRQETVSAYTDFDYKTVKPVPDETKTITYYDNASKQNVTATLKLKELKEADSWAWRNDVVIPITFSIYDADFYALGDELVPYDDNAPALKGYESAVLDELQLDKDLYRINRFEWSGEPYTVGEVRYRNAVAYGERYAANYIAVYEDTVNLPNAAGYNAAANYTAQVSVPNGQQEYTVEATAVYTPNHTTAIIIGGVLGGIVFIALLVVAILYIISKKDKRRETNG